MCTYISMFLWFKLNSVIGEPGGSFQAKLITILLLKRTAENTSGHQSKIIVNGIVGIFFFLTEAHRVF